MAALKKTTLKTTLKPKTTLKTTKSRGGLLTAWLVLMVISNSISAVAYLFFNDVLQAVVPDLPVSLLYGYGLLSVINLFCTYFLFRWKKWAFYAYCAVAGIGFILNVIFLDIVSALLGLLGPLILYILLKPKWKLLV